RSIRFAEGSGDGPPDQPHGGNGLAPIRFGGEAHGNGIDAHDGDGSLDGAPEVIGDPVAWSVRSFIDRFARHPAAFS
ncbi:MAG: hypothetical protein EB140_08135, partial [Proteobacteria bacterium]|nr:hypothetical protein [Pseudomonadota bacterium]